MTLLLTLEQGPRSQAVRQARLETGELVIGRSSDADWQIDDPDMFVSRAHCKITAERDGYFITDTSSSGLFIDDSESPLGPGNSARLRNGMRLRLGDYVLWVEVMQESQPSRSDTRPPAAAPPPRPASLPPVNFDTDDFFSKQSEEEPRRPRPADLPSPFDQPEPGAYRAFERESAPSIAFDDPFSLDPVATPQEGARPDRQAPASAADPFGFGAAAPMDPSPVAPPSEDRRPAAEARPSPAPWNLPDEPPAAPPPASPAKKTPAPQSRPAPASAAPAGNDLRAAFLRGLGFDEESGLSSGDAVAEMEKFGREYRAMMQGLMQLLRKRAEEKGNARVSQTVVGASDVNPLKFLPTVDDVLVTILAERSPGFLSRDAAISDAVRDLAEHHVRAWRGVQAALRRMIDRFDPVVIEEELKSSSTLETLFACGRSAKLWELYQKRHREIAISAEQTFLGEIGADFRNAYEEE
jgi:type VI secretion system protein ImpI